MPSVNSKMREKRRTLSVFVAVTIIFSAAVSVWGLLYRAEIAEQNEKNVELSAYLEAIEAENTRLKIEICSLNPPATESGEEVSIEVKKEDKAVILNKDGDRSDNRISSVWNIFLNGK